MDRAREIERIPTMRTGTTARVAQTPGARVTDVAKSRAINGVREEIRVVDVNGEELGNVEYIKMGHPSATTVSPATQYDPSLIEAFFGMSDPDLSEPLPNRLLSSGDVKIDDKDWIASNHSITASSIGSISGDTVTLTVDSDHTLTEWRRERRPTSVVTGWRILQLKRLFAWIWGTATLAFAIVVAFVATVGVLSVAAQDATPSGEQEEACAEVMAAATPEATAAATPVAERCVAIESYDIYFEPNLVTIPANTPVTIALPNAGSILHNFSITDHNNPDLPFDPIDVDIQPGETKSVMVNAPPGTYYFFCDVPGHEAAGMFGYLVVEEGVEISAETATVTPPAGS